MKNCEKHGVVRPYIYIFSFTLWICASRSFSPRAKVNDLRINETTNNQAKCANTHGKNRTIMVIYGSNADACTY